MAARHLAQFSSFLVAVALLAAVSLLPPDTALSEVRRSGTLTACVPAERAPLVMQNAAAPGVDVEILRAVAADLGVALRLNTVSAMGEDFNPQSWNLTRAQCAVIAGGLVDSPQTRSFLEVSPPYATTGWVTMQKPSADLSSETGRRVGIFAGVQGFDRIALSQYLRGENRIAIVVRTPEDLAAGLEAGRFPVGITEALIGRALAAPRGWTVQPLPAPFKTDALVFGLWKGDLTLKRAVVDSLEHLRDSGQIGAILRKYGVE